MTEGRRRSLANTLKLYMKESNKPLHKHLWFMRTLYTLLLSKKHETAENRLMMAYICKNEINCL